MICSQHIHEVFCYFFHTKSSKSSAFLTLTHLSVDQLHFPCSGGTRLAVTVSDGADLEKLLHSEYKEVYTRIYSEALFIIIERKTGNNPMSIKRGK